MNRIGCFITKLNQRVFDTSLVSKRTLQQAFSGRLKNLPTNTTTQRSNSPFFQFHRHFKRSRPKENGPMTNPFDHYIKPLIFTAGVAGVSFVGCSIWQYEAYRNLLGPRRSNANPREWGLTQDGSLQDLTQRMGIWWDSIPRNERIFWPICIANILVCAAWRIPSLTAPMLSYFSANPFARRICTPMLLSVFSHYSVVHLGVNMFVLHSFIPTATQLLGREQFLAFYLTSGVVASLGSHFFKIATKSLTPSLGASGAIMGILGLVCSQLPDIKLGIIFIPGFYFTADTALKCIIAVDAVGLFAGWRFLDHAAHLSGCLFGVAYGKFAIEPLKRARDFIIEYWHNFRIN